MDAGLNSLLGLVFNGSSGSPFHGKDATENKPEFHKTDWMKPSDSLQHIHDNESALDAKADASYRRDADVPNRTRMNEPFPIPGSPPEFLDIGNASPHEYVALRISAVSL